MSKNPNILKSKFIIDGIKEELTPEQILEESRSFNSVETIIENSDTILDERTDPEPNMFEYNEKHIYKYLKKIRENSNAERKFPIEVSTEYTKVMLARKLIEAIWSKGHFKSGDLAINATWIWNPAPIGNMAAFYDSVSSLAESIDEIDIKINSYNYSETDGNSKMILSTELADSNDISIDLPYKTTNPVLEKERKCPEELIERENSWLIYMPFDYSEYQMGGSFLAQLLNKKGNPAPEVADPEYFKDCYEIVRELVEDGIIHSGTTISDGGIMTALDKMAGGKFDIEANISSIMHAYEENDMVKILFSEAPGILFQVDDYDYDYIDAELTLQDVAYYPLCNPKKGTGKIKAICEDNHIATILNSLIVNKSGPLTSIDE